MDSTTKPQGHKHAALMAEFARDAAGMERPWEAWEFYACHDEGWVTCASMPAWTSDGEYRRKPRTIRIGGMDVPEPVRVALEKGTPYWMPVLMSSGTFAIAYSWDGGSADQRWLARGFIHLTQKAAEAHGRALVALTEGKA